MGQKIHPVGFRLGVTHDHWSNWFIKPQRYSELLQEDERIRDCIKQCVRESIRTSFSCGGITRVKIQRRMDSTKVEIYTGFPALWVTRRRIFEQLRQNIQKTLNRINWLTEWAHNLDSVKDTTSLDNNIDQMGLDNRKFVLTLEEVQNPYAEATILAEYIALQLENRVAFRKIMKKAIDLALKIKSVKGIKVQIAGRLNGAEIARTEWAREGRVPLQTLRARIDYCEYRANTIYGVLGIKVWVFQES
uniref:Small ribosomal subunit protein uS3c n=1 Tax=Netrium digitus TaxID=43946 RepID=A0A191T562_9VIRI|nr:ribosomal protein S3 [Netrium digitus]ANI25538.1 ribosomal protein S3 [Netrium digitus]